MKIRIVKENTQPFEDKTKYFLEHNVVEVDINELGDYLVGETLHPYFNFAIMIERFLQEKLS